MSRSFDRLTKILIRLRSRRGGCPWDLKQTPDSLKPFLIEEAYEVIEAIESKDNARVIEELGDLLYQVLFHAQIARERGRFTIRDVLKATADKMVRRHPHVFGRDRGARRGRTAAEVLVRWEELKAEEKGNRHRTSVLDGIPKQLPALLRAQQLQARAARVGFDWPAIEPVLKKVREELREFEEARKSRSKIRMEEELGDVLFALVNLARFLKINAEDALRKTSQRFIQRFQYIEQAAAKKRRPVQDLSLSEMDRLWEEAKQLPGNSR
ncbi:MAG TPA: nucleoside triphosphate pyrophosphohydrolase [Nitrospiria bacterium]|jgi:tetrapyrrole methylase family protein/MazG family protein|nr:nucleoside triphosphate pyrophosphohydrolase [Nitrospiria bacterium]